MSLWEYKVITSGKGGFARPDMMEKFLNDLGRDEWEIVQFHTQPDNFLVFTGLARRPTQRDWTLQDAAAAAAKAEAEKLRAEFEAKFKAAASNAPAAGEERSPSFIEEKAAPDDGFRKPVDTSRDDDPEAQEDDKADEWDKLTAAEEDELPTFFEAIKPHMRRNQRGAGMSVGVDYLAKKWDQAEEDLKGALAECGFVVPTDEDSKPEYLEYDGDLYWLNINRRGELWINTKEKPRPVFRSVKAQKIIMDEPAAKPDMQPQGQNDARPETGNRRPETAERASEAGIAEPQAQNSKPQTAPAAGGASLPAGIALLDKIRPHMRRNRRGPGGSGSTSFLSRALRTNEADLKTAFAALGLTLPTSANDKAVYTEVGNELWWLNVDSRGGLWINGREKKQGETALGAAAADASATPEAGGANSSEQPATPGEAAAGAAAPDAVPTPEVAPSSASANFSSAPDAAASRANDTSVLGAVRLLLKETRTGSISAKTERVAEELGKSGDELIATLTGAGLRVPEKPREKPVFIEHAGEIFWLNRNAKGELWLNAKASKFADKTGSDGDEGQGGGEAGAEGDGQKKPARRGGGRSPRPKKAAEPEAGAVGEPASEPGP
jgi:hypothetical protein